jgi:hypothetical protein
VGRSWPNEFTSPTSCDFLQLDLKSMVQILWKHESMDGLGALILSPLCVVWVMYVQWITCCGGWPLETRVKLERSRRLIIGNLRFQFGNPMNT